MKYVPRQWLRWFQLVLFGIDLIVLGIYLYETFIGGGQSPGLHHLGGVHSHGSGASMSTWGVSPLIAGLAATHALYAISIVWWFDKRHIWQFHASAISISGVMLVLLANSDSPLHSMYHVFLMCFMFFAAMVGFIVVGAVFALAFIFLIIGSLGSDHLTTDPSGHVFEMVLVMLSALSGSIGYFVFSKKYIQAANAQAVETLTKAVKQERTTVNLILESITDGVMIIGTNGVVELMNNSAAKMLGWSKDEAKNLQYNALIQLAENPEEVQKPNESSKPAEPPTIDLAFKTGQPQQQVRLIKTRDQRQVYLDIAASPIYQEQAGDKRVVAIIAVLRNVDKQKREEQQRTEFISTASHEMRTPVAAIEGYLALALNDKVSGIDTKARGYLEKAHESTQHLGKLFQDLLTSTKAEDGRLSSHPVAVEMGQYLEQLVESLRFTAEKKGLFMEFLIGAGTTQEQGSIMSGKVVKPLYYVLVDPDRMREVITNLFDNAVKYTGEGKVSIGLTGNDQVVQVYVRDTGPGIPADDISHLFQKFYRVDNSATRTIGGTGLGLFISRKIVELYKGRIWVESQLNKGSTFYINLPRLTTQKATDLQAAEAATQPTLEKTSRSGGTS
jgi:PAS domain S-box-containing protein